MYVINGDPVPLARPRYGRSRIWDSQKEHKLVAGISLRNQHGSKPLYQGPIHLDITFFMQLPESNRRHVKPGQYHYFKCDLDNLIKFVADVGNSILYKDDCIISSIAAKKIYDHNPRTEFEILTINPRAINATKK